MAPNHRNEILKAVTEVFDEASREHFAGYLKRAKAVPGIAGPAWDITNNPLDLGSDRRSKEFQKIRRLQQRLIADLKDGVKAPQQLELLP